MFLMEIKRNEISFVSAGASNGVVVITTAQLHSTKPGSAQVQILLAARRRFAMVRISNNCPDWK